MELLSFNICSMKNLVCLVAARLFEELLVNLLDYRAVVRLSERKIEVLLIQSLCTLRLQISEVAHACRLNRLTAAVYTAARTAHNLDELIISLARLNLVEHCSRIPESAGYCNLNVNSATL